MGDATSILRTELDGFAGRHGLTPREHDVVFLLVNGFSSVAQIAERLGLSRNTIHNHFKNVFRRTRTNSKAGLLALFIEQTLGRQASERPFIKRPQVLVVDDDATTRTELERVLTDQGMDVVVEARSDRAVERIAEHRIDVVVVDQALPGASGDGVLHDVRSRFGNHPSVLLTTSSADASPTDWEARGAGGLFEKPVSTDRLAFAILEHFVDSPYERNRLMRVDTDMPGCIDDKLDVSIANVGFGGAFIPLRDDALMDAHGLKVGARIGLQFRLTSDQPISAEGEVMWRNRDLRPSVNAGLGIKFVRLSKTHRLTLEEFVRRKKLTNALPWQHQAAKRQAVRA